MSVKERLHQLVDDLPDTELHTAERFLEYLRSLQDEVDDEPLSAEARAALERAEEQFRRGESVTLEQLKRENGL